MDEIEKIVDEIPGDGEFYKSTTRDEYIRIGIQLKEQGFNFDEVREILNGFWSATLDEFGC